MTVTVKADAGGTTGVLQVGGNDILKFGADNSGQLRGFRNRVINGDCRVAQRGNVAAALGSWKYGGADRIRAGLFSYSSGSGTIARATGIGSPPGNAQGLVGVTTTGAGQVYFSTLLEQANVFDLSGKTVTFSVNLYQNTGAPVNAPISLYKANSPDVFSTLTLLGSNTVSVPNGGNGAKGTLTVTLGATDAANGLALYVYFPTGAITSKNFYTWDWQFEEGSIVTPFEWLPLGLELALCQRYYYKTYNQSVVPGTSDSTGSIFSAVQAICNYFTFLISLPVTMYKSPVVVAYSPGTGAIGNALFDGVDKAVLTIGYATSISARVNNSAVNTNQFGTVHLTADAELS
jgi:hypothetical protein